MRRRRRREEEPVSHERWLVSYADFITLLFAFFVVMYSISQVSESKYRVLSDTLEQAFNRPQGSLNPIQVGAAPRPGPVHLMPIELPVRSGSSVLTPAVPSASAAQFRRITAALREQLGDLLASDMVVMRGSEEWLEIDLRSSLLFDSGDDRLSNSAMELLGQIAHVLRGNGYAIRVEGFTDNRPINTARFPSNWTLAAARAASVVQLFLEEGIPPFQLMAASYGEFQPAADNGTEEGRARNRRVVLMISRDGRLRAQLPPLDPLTAPPAARQ